MNASQIISDDMTLEEKLNAIDAAMQAAQAVADEQARANGSSQRRPNEHTNNWTERTPQGRS